MLRSRVFVFEVRMVWLRDTQMGFISHEGQLGSVKRDEESYFLEYPLTVCLERAWGREGTLEVRHRELMMMREDPRCADGLNVDDSRSAL